MRGDHPHGVPPCPSRHALDLAVDAARGLLVDLIYGGHGVAKKELRCDRVKRSDALVVWDDPAHPKGNRRKVRAHGLTEDEVESVLSDDDAAVVPNRTPEHCLVFGYTYGSAHRRRLGDPR